MVSKRQFIIVNRTTFVINVHLTVCDETERPFT